MNPYDKNKFFKVFRAGKYPQGNVSVDDLKEIAANYSTDYKKSPLTLEHKDGKSYAWVHALKVDGDTLLAAFDEVSDEAINLTKGDYRYPSVEIANYEHNGKKMKYLRAISLTNFNEVKALPQLKFSDDNVIAYYSEFNIQFENSENQTSYMKNLIKKFSGKFGLKLSDNATEDELFNAVCAKFDENPNQDKELLQKYNELQTEIKSINQSRVEDVLESAVATGKITPAQKDKYRKFAEVDIDSAKTVFNEMPVLPEFKKDVVNGSNVSRAVDTTDAKFSKKDGTHYTYEEVIKDPKLVKTFSESELAALKEKSSVVFS